MSVFEAEGTENERLPDEDEPVVCDVVSNEEPDAYLGRRGHPEVKQHQPIAGTVGSYVLKEQVYSD